MIFGKFNFVRKKKQHVEIEQFYKATTPHHVRNDTNLNGRVEEWCDVVLAVQIVVKTADGCSSSSGGGGDIGGGGGDDDVEFFLENARNFFLRVQTSRLLTKTKNIVIIAKKQKKNN